MIVLDRPMMRESLWLVSLRDASNAVEAAGYLAKSWREKVTQECGTSLAQRFGPTQISRWLALGFRSHCLTA